MKPIQSKPISNAKQDAQQLLAEIRIAEAQISATWPRPIAVGYRNKR